MSRTALTALLAALAAAALLHAPISTFGHGLWGPESPWTHRDFLGAWWLFWASATRGDALALLAWPDGALPIQHHIPNPFDGWLLGPLVAHLPAPLWWNAMQLGHHLGNIAATVWLAQAAGARRGDALAAGLLVAASPVMLHEIAGGRTLSGAVWPGLVGLALLLRRRPWASGVFLGIQGLCYLYTGGLFLLAALTLRPRDAVKSSLIVAATWAPYLAWLWPVLGGLHGHAAPAGATEWPLAGAFALDVVPERYWLHPALLLGLLGLARRWRWGLVGAGALFIALGPEPGWLRGSALFVSPLAWVQYASPALARLHHPIRAVFLLIPVLAVGLALWMGRRPRWVAVPLGALALLLQPGLERACAWDVDPVPPGAQPARWLAQHGTAVVDLTGEHGAALGLQPIHGLPMLQSLKRERPQPGRRAGALQARVDAWTAPDPQLVRDLHDAGFSHVLAVDRGALDTRQVEADLGPPVVPGVYAIP